jgi:hypothetical protein
MCNTTSILDDASPPTAVPVVAMIETTVSTRISAFDKVAESNVQKRSSRFRNVLAYFAGLLLLCAIVTGAEVYIWDRRWLEAQVGVTRAPFNSLLPTTSSYFSDIVMKKEEEELEGVGKLIQDLAHFDNAKVNAALDALYNMNFKQKYDTVTAWGGCAALVHLLKDRLETAMQKVPQCDQVTELHELPELVTIEMTVRVITRLTYYSSEMGRTGMVAVGGAAAVVKAMKTFPKCQNLQMRACTALVNLACDNATGKKQVIELGGIELLLAAIARHVDSAGVCEKACWALFNIVYDSNENTRLLISLGGGAAVAKVRTKWPDNTRVQTQVRRLNILIVLAEMKAWFY